MAVSKRLKKIYNHIFEIPETFAANFISNFQERQTLNRYLDKEFHLSNDQKAEIKDFWSPYKRISWKWAAYYGGKNDIFDPRYIPNNLYYTVIDQHFNSRRLGYGFNDKNYYSKIFDGIEQPKVIVRRINNLWFDCDYNLISPSLAESLIRDQGEVICKPSQESGSGRGIVFLCESDNRGGGYKFLCIKYLQ